VFENLALTGISRSSLLQSKYKRNETHNLMFISFL